MFRYLVPCLSPCIFVASVAVRAVVVAVRLMQHGLFDGSKTGTRQVDECNRVTGGRVNDSGKAARANPKDEEKFTQMGFTDGF